MERVKGIEPSYAAWEAAVLPLNYTRPEDAAGRGPGQRAILASRRTAWQSGAALGRANIWASTSAPTLLSVPPMIRLTLNGQPENLDVPLTVAGLLERRGLAGKRVAVERNGEIVPRGQHAATQLTEGDVLEIVVAVGGG